MHGAPSVTYPAGRSSLAGVVMLAVWFAGAAGVALWSVQARTTFAGIAAACVLLFASGVIALHAWWRSPQGFLAWDGAGWTWTADATHHAGEPLVALDTQRLLLVRWRAEGRARWLWLERGRQPLRWDDLRRAVYSRPTP